jgi:hypothetical protein
MARDKAEADTERDVERVDSREPDGEYVGRVSQDESEATGETGAERRAESG